MNSGVPLSPATSGFVQVINSMVSRDSEEDPPSATTEDDGPRQELVSEVKER